MAFHHNGYERPVDRNRFPTGVVFELAQRNFRDGTGHRLLDPGFSIPQSYSSAHFSPESINNIGCLPLLEVSVDVRVAATTSQTLLVQSFINYTDSPIEEATYLFPLYDGSAVVSFSCTIGDSVFKGQVKANNEAIAQYRESVTRHCFAALLDEHTPEIFETRLGCIPAHTLVKIEIAFINELKADLGGEGVLVTIPTSVAPRYGTPPYLGRSTVQEVGDGLRIQVEVSAPVPIRRLESRTHPISVELGAAGDPTPVNSVEELFPGFSVPGPNPNRARATLSDDQPRLNKDFVLLILTSAEHGSRLLASHALVEEHPTVVDSLAMMVTLNPCDLFTSHLSSDAFRGEIIFVADRSGSMRNKMESLKRAMIIFLRSLPPTCHFNIWSYGTDCKPLWPVSNRYTQETLDFATQHISTSFESDMGGTELLLALKTVTSGIDNETDTCKEIILVTDGEVWGREETIKFVRSVRERSNNTVRFFALGLGNAVSHSLLEGIGRYGGGFAEMVDVDGVGEWKSRVTRMLKGALTPPRWQCDIGLMNRSGNFSSLVSQHPNTERDVDQLGARIIEQPCWVQAPFHIPPLNAFARSSVYFLVSRRSINVLSQLTIQGTESSGRSVSVNIPIVNNGPGIIIHSLAAKAVMTDMENGQSWLHARNYDPDTLERAVQELGERYGKQWGLSGKWTSFVATSNTGQSENASSISRPARSELSDLTMHRYESASGGISLPPGRISTSQGGRSIPEGGSPSTRRGTSLLPEGTTASLASEFPAQRETTIPPFQRRTSGFIWPNTSGRAQLGPTSHTASPPSLPPPGSIWSSPHSTSKSPYSLRSNKPSSKTQFRKGRSYRSDVLAPESGDYDMLVAAGSPAVTDLGEVESVNTTTSTDPEAIMQDIWGEGYRTRSASPKLPLSFDEAVSDLESAGREPRRKSRISALSMNKKISSSPQRAAGGGQDFHMPRKPSRSGDPFDSLKAGHNDSGKYYLESSPRSSSPSFTDLVEQQNYQGFFCLRGAVRETIFSNFDHQLLERIEKHLPNLKETKGRLTMFKSNSQVVCETIIVIAYVEEEYSRSFELWELVIKKARDWLKEIVGSATDLEALMELVRDSWQTAVAPEFAKESRNSPPSLDSAESSGDLRNFKFLSSESKFPKEKNLKHAASLEDSPSKSIPSPTANISEFSKGSWRHRSLLSSFIIERGSTSATVTNDGLPKETTSSMAGVTNSKATRRLKFSTALNRFKRKRVATRDYDPLKGIPSTTSNPGAPQNPMRPKSFSGDMFKKIERSDIPVGQNASSGSICSSTGHESNPFKSIPGPPTSADLLGREGIKDGLGRRSILALDLAEGVKYAVSSQMLAQASTKATYWPDVDYSQNTLSMTSIPGQTLLRRRRNTA